MTAARLLVVGTHNRKKLRELAELLDSREFVLQSLADFPHALTVAETGHSFAENATLKATSQARHLGQWVLAEDSGLVVDALGGAPGIHSARFSGAGATDASNNRLLLEKLRDVSSLQRTAQYVCHVALSDPTGAVCAVSEAMCRGRIRLEPAGAAGFGYDPLFEIVEYHRTFGELGECVKSVISHRGRALRAIMPALRRLLR